MELKHENKSNLTSKIDKQTSSRPLFYLKFCREKKFAQDICEGNLFGNTAEYFRQQEIKNGERGQGDRFETTLQLKTKNIAAINRETGKIVLTAPKGTLSVRFGVDKIIPIVSFVGIPFEQMTVSEEYETHASFTFPFTEKEYACMQEKFGKYCVVISGKELEEKIEKYCKSNGYDYVFEAIEYCSQNGIDRIKVFNSGAKERFLYKNQDLAYQREYRLAIATEIPKDHFIRIGKLTSAACIESENLKDLIITINYKPVPESGL